MTTAVIKSIYPAEGTLLDTGAKFVDMSVDLSQAMVRDCPPISYFRVALRERVWLRRLAVGPGDEVGVGDSLGQFSTEPGEALDGEPVRALRVTIAGIVYQAAWWDQE
jgi:hypothetical protein